MSFNSPQYNINAAPTPPPPAADEEEFYSSWSLFLVCLLLVLSLWTSYYLQIKRIRAVHETTVSIFAGMFVGLIIRLAPGTMIRDMLTFKHTLFFNLLLPPIILNSGYELKQENFFRNFGSIIVFAFFGTFISAVGVGVLVYIYSMLGIESMNLTLVDCLSFGSTLSATDPVTILAIFNQYKVDPKLYTVIFGESLLNDAVSIVMYETLHKFRGTEVYLSSIFHGVGIFLLSFSVSMLLGVAFGLAMSLLLKHSHLNHFPHIESCLVALSAYLCYFLSTGLTLSGIVSLLFCGITLKHYAYHTMSRRTQRGSKALFGTLAHLSENFIFIYLGIALFTSAPVSEPVFSYVKPIFILITTVAVVFTRYAAVFPLSEAINFVAKHLLGHRQEVLPHSYQMMLFWAGLRGAVGVALAAGFSGPNAKVLRMTVLLVVVITVLFFGGTTSRMLEVLKIKTNVEDEDGSSSDEEEYPVGSRWLAGGRTSRRWNRNNEFEETTALSRDPGRIGTHYARNFDQYRDGNSVPQSPTVHQALFSSASSESYDSDTEVLPLAPTARREQQHPDHSNRGGESAAGEEGKWFQAIDERYLLPLFSNATASRTFHARKSARKQAANNNSSVVGSTMHLEDVGGNASGSRGGGNGGDEIEIDLGGLGAQGRPQGVRPAVPRLSSVDDSRVERGLGSPVLRGSGNSSSPQS
ncbi:sodium/hydrogen exchanger [Coprinopsis marcescibilis]|uniref:Sodium/hydrogen exchanger n=1 Tax=Coprinopsis marcescibilis TaxID=230819 RepID=A0A5C3L7Y2_COPMA|nr:sodium/hydrogen exchanger [Coprinopsis marcescibilis]